MSLVPCPECAQQISERAGACPHCGCPRDPGGAQAPGPWQAALRARTPINVFAIAMMACAAVFGFSATRLGERALAAFTYSLHTFLAIAGMFFVCLLFCRRAIYHPEDLARAARAGVEIGPDQPRVAAALIAGMLLAYGGDQGLVASDQLEPTAASAGTATTGGEAQGRLTKAASSSPAANSDT